MSAWDDLIERAVEAHEQEQITEEIDVGEARDERFARVCDLLEKEFGIDPPNEVIHIGAANYDDVRFRIGRQEFVTGGERGGVPFHFKMLHLETGEIVVLPGVVSVGEPGMIQTLVDLGRLLEGMEQETSAGGTLGQVEETLRKPADYYELPVGKRWLGGGNSPSGIGGRDTDFAQIGYSLHGIIKEHYPMNEVPVEVLRDLEALTKLLKLGEMAVRDFIASVTGRELALLEDEVPEGSKKDK